MDSVRLLVTFKFNGDRDCQIRRATRISLDKTGRLIVYGTNRGTTDILALDGIQLLALEACKGPVVRDVRTADLP